MDAILNWSPVFMSLLWFLIGWTRGYLSGRRVEQLKHVAVTGWPPLPKPLPPPPAPPPPTRPERDPGRVELSRDVAELARSIADQHRRWPLVDEDYIPERRPDVVKSGGR